MVGEAIEHGGGHLGVAEDLDPFPEGEVRGDYVELGQQSTFLAIVTVVPDRCRRGLETFEKPLDCCHITVYGSTFVVGQRYLLKHANHACLRGDQISL